MGYLEAIEEMISLVKNTQLSPVFNIYILKFVIVNLLYSAFFSYGIHKL
jgi:hypothetical protein